MPTSTRYNFATARRSSDNDSESSCRSGTPCLTVYASHHVRQAQECLTYLPQTNVVYVGTNETEGTPIRSAADRKEWSHLRKPYTPERAYGCSVLPFGTFMIVGGIVLFIGAMLSPSEAIFVPPFSDPWIKRAVFGGVSLSSLLLGIGFCLRSTLAWWSFFVWVLLGTAWGVVAEIRDLGFLVIIPVTFNVIFAVGVYFATKPVFVARS
jgi:hypothetical protein